MYNHYIRDENGNYTRVAVEERSPFPPQQSPIIPAIESPQRERIFDPPPPPREHRPVMPPPPSPQAGAPHFPFGQLLGQLHMGDVDSGDLLLLGLLFFLFRKGADEELLIALGLLMIL